MIRLIFVDGRARGHVTVDYSSNSDKEVVKKVAETELNTLVPDSFEGDWRDNRRHFKLEDGEIVFDEDYTPPEEGE